MILFQNSYLSVYHIATILFQDIHMTLDFPVRVLYNSPIVSFLIHSACSLSPFFSSKILIADAASTKALNLTNLLPHQAFVEAIFFGFKSAPTVMATSDHVPEVCFQVPVLKVSIATLRFLSSRIYFIWFLGNKD